MNKEDWMKVAKNFLVFGAPVLVVFFTQLAEGVEIKEAGKIALFAFYQLIVDILKKFSAGK